MISPPTNRGGRPGKWRPLIWTLQVVVILVAGSEAGLRMAGLVDFPIYDSDAKIGYIPQASQSGSFLNRNDWSINEKSMGSPDWAPNVRPDLLLLGDSVVWCGNTYLLADRFAPQLQSVLPEASVWSASAGSWSVLNEVEYLDRFPEVWEATDILVWVINASDFTRRTQWETESTHPRHGVSLATWYCIEKYWVPHLPKWLKTRSSDVSARPVKLPLIGEESVASFTKRLGEAERDGKPVLLVLFPAQSDLAERSSGGSVKYQTFTKLLSKWQGAPNIALLDMLQVPAWNESHYRDTAHLSPAGSNMISEIIAEKLREREPTGRLLNAETPEGAH